MKEKPLLHSALGICLSASMLLSGCGLVSYQPDQSLLGEGASTAGTGAVKVRTDFEAELAVRSARLESDSPLALVELLQRDFAESVSDIRDLTEECDEKGTVVTLDYTTDAYRSAGEGVLQKSLMVYLPYGYDESQQYDILYLLHGSRDSTGDMSHFWLDEHGRATCAVLDNMIQQGLCKPVIVVCPTYYTASGRTVRVEDKTEDSEEETEDRQEEHTKEETKEELSADSEGEAGEDVPEKEASGDAEKDAPEGDPENGSGADSGEEEKSVSSGLSLVRTAYAPMAYYAPRPVRAPEELPSEPVWDWSPAETAAEFAVPEFSGEVESAPAPEAIPEDGGYQVFWASEMNAPAEPAAPEGETPLENDALYIEDTQEVTAPEELVGGIRVDVPEGILSETKEPEGEEASVPREETESEETGTEEGALEAEEASQEETGLESEEPALMMTAEPPIAAETEMKDAGKPEDDAETDAEAEDGSREEDAEQDKGRGEKEDAEQDKGRGEKEDAEQDKGRGEKEDADQKKDDGGEEDGDEAPDDAAAGFFSAGYDPYGYYGGFDYGTSGSGWQTSTDYVSWISDADWLRLFGSELRNDIIPAVESAYSTYAGGDVSEKSLVASRDHRAFAGLSMGSKVVARSGLIENVDLFAWFGTYSGIWYDFGRVRDALEDTCGTYDVRFWYNGNGNMDYALGEHEEFHRRVLSELSEQFEEGENYAFVTLSDGGHSYSSWLADLSNSLLIFFLE